MTQPAAPRAFGSRQSIEAAGFAPGWHGEPVAVGDAVVVRARGGWRVARAIRVTPRYVYADVTTPTSPELHTVARGSRLGSDGTDLYVPRPKPDPAATCGEPHPSLGRPCVLPPHATGGHRAADGLPWSRDRHACARCFAAGRFTEAVRLVGDAWCCAVHANAS